MKLEQKRAISYSYYKILAKKTAEEIEKAKADGLSFKISKYNRVTLSRIKKARDERGKEICEN